jgi:hypothetical protein
MKPQTQNHEILLFTNTSFSRRQLCEREDDFNNKPSNPSEEMEKACWSGLLFEMLPDILEAPTNNNMSFIWEVVPVSKFIRINVGATPQPVEHETSVDPYFFLSAQNFN